MSTSVRRQLLLQVGGQLFAVHVRQAVEILELVDATPVPGAVPAVLGLINVRGRLLVAGDLATLLGLTPTNDDEAAFVVLEAGERRVAWRVDRVVGFAPLPEGGLDVESDLLEALGARELVSGVGRLGPRPYFQLDLKMLFDLVLAGDGDTSLQHGTMGGR